MKHWSELSDEERRAETIQGLRDLANFLERTPEAPVPYEIDASMHFGDRSRFLAAVTSINATEPDPFPGEITRWRRRFTSTVSLGVQVETAMLREEDQPCAA